MDDIWSSYAKDTGDDSPNAQKKPLVSESVNALSEDLAQFATGRDKHDRLDLLSDFQPNTVTASSAADTGSTPPAYGDLLHDASPGEGAPPLKPSAPPAPEKVAPAAAEPDLEPRPEPKNPPPPKRTAPEELLPVADVKPTPVASSTSTRPKAAEMQREATSTTSFSKNSRRVASFRQRKVGVNSETRPGRRRLEFREPRGGQTKRPTEFKFTALPPPEE
ncbi:hypothetical protein MRX96_052441 [Rhipicephalus microplus]